MYTTVSRIILGLLMLCGWHVQANTETIQFDVFLFGNKIGTSVLTREKPNDSTEVFTLKTKAKATILWIDRDNQTTYEVVYRHGRLYSSATREVENGSVKNWNKVQSDGTRYTITDAKGERTVNEVPKFSIVKVFFEDATKVNRLFFESDGSMYTMLHPEPNTCEFKSKDGGRNIYRYVNGRLEMVEFHVTFATVHLKRVK